ncbi:MAG: secretin N-terminal domain-containing protein, partial [Planctomycetaceae bacterium]
MFERRTSPRAETENVEERAPAQPMRDRPARASEPVETGASRGASNRDATSRGGEDQGARGRPSAPTVEGEIDDLAREVDELLEERPSRQPATEAPQARVEMPASVPEPARKSRFSGLWVRRASQGAIGEEAAREETPRKAGTSDRRQAAQAAPAREADAPRRGRAQVGREAEGREPAGRAGGRAASQESDVSASVVGGKLLIAGSDMEQLDQVESLIESFVQTSPNQPRWIVYYLRAADATETATTLGALFPQGSITQTATQNSGFFGSLTGGLSSLGGSLMDMTGMNSLGGAAQPLRIIPELRSNSLFISGPHDQVQSIMEALQVLDAAELPESFKDRVPRLIPVEYADATEVYSILRDVFREQIDPTMGNPLAAMQRGGGGFNPLAMMMGGGGGNQQQGGRRPRAVDLTLGVDER